MQDAGAPLLGGHRHALCRRGFGHGCALDRYVGPAENRLAEFDLTLDQGEQGVVLADTDIGAGMELGAALAHDDVAGDDAFTTELLDAKTTAGAVATVAGATACLFMCHCSQLLY